MYLYWSLYKKNKQLNSEKDILKDNLKENLLNLNLRAGFYKQTFKLAVSEDASKTSNYDIKIHIIEEERYLNGYSKIKHIKTDILNGFRTDQYDYIKKLSILKFDTIVKTSDIEWLEVDPDIKELRINKITSVLNEIEKDEKNRN
jgi:hypothetical protein